MSDAINYFAGKKLFAKLDCSQAYHCVQMAEDISVELLELNLHREPMHINVLPKD